MQLGQLVHTVWRFRLVKTDLDGFQLQVALAGPSASKIGEFLCGWLQVFFNAAR